MYLEKTLGYTFSNTAWMTQALTHRSAGSPHYERLEFLGDALLGALISIDLVARYPHADEGVLTRMRIALVRQASLVQVAEHVRLNEHLILGPGERASGAHQRAAILADGVEALIAAVFLDSNWETMQRVVRTWFAPLLEALPLKPIMEKDPKTLLQEHLQAAQKPLPTYTLVATEGPPHEPVFKVRCTVGTQHCEAQANSRRIAEHLAAVQMLEQLNHD